MIIYRSYCPVHKGKELLVTQDELINIKKKDGSSVKKPAFFCDKCKRYYLYNGKPNSKIMDTGHKLGSIPVFFSGIKYDLYEKGKKTSTAKKMTTGSWSSWANSHSSGAAGSGKTFKTEPHFMSKSSGKSSTHSAKLQEPIVRIRILSKEEMEGKLLTNYNNIRMAYPGIVTDKMEINHLIRKVFPAGIEQNVVVRNETVKSNNGYLLRIAEIYNKQSSYLKKFLPENTYLSFGGKIIKGEFVITELRILENPIPNIDDTEAKLAFVYDGPNQQNWLYTITEQEAQNTTKLEGELADWNDYLDWKRQLAELRIKGLKYIGFKVDTEEREMTFLAVSEGKDVFDEFRKYLRRNEVSIFSNNYSNNRWYFEFNHDYQDNANSDSGVALTFIRLGDSYNINAINQYEWNVVRNNAKKYDTDSRSIDTQFLMNGIERNYFSPHFVELVFEISPNASNIIDRQLRRYGELKPDVEETIANEFYADGYIATSQIGDFALLRRLKNAITDLANGKSASHGLAQWLFDIKKARVPQSITGITSWQNPAINKKQKEAVEKILSVPDVCLIQGPPGTGKTTVIAEAIYQLVIRNKRVMVASQANLAVDNALERLISNPKIRAIRLGSAKKIDASVSNITEENVLESFYDSIVSYIDKQYLKKWTKADAIKEAGDYDYQRFQDALQKDSEIQSQISAKEEQLQQLDSDDYMQSEYLRQNEARIQKINLKMLESFCKGTIDDLELLLSKDSLILIWNNIEATVLSIGEKGVHLTKVGLDIHDLEDPKRIKIANDILAQIFLNGKNAITLLEKLNSSQQFGGESKEIEELRIQEQKLEKQVLMSMDPKDLVEWKAVKQKIIELSESGAGLSKTEEKLFDMDLLSGLDNDKKREYLLSCLTASLPLIQDMLQSAEKSTADLIEEIDKEEAFFEKKIQENNNAKEILTAEITSLKSESQIHIRLREAILKKYKATPENLKQNIGYYIEAMGENLQTSIDRTDWEEIFRGLKEWVAEIPDYMQEKDIYLKEFINGCNVVGVSCTENARTLLENGFDDFDVVIIDEVSKATPPELLIPMLRGRKIVLVGDHRQLPPLFNEHEKTYQEVAEQQEGIEDIIVPLTMSDFNKYKDMVTASLFERYFENASSIIKETLQYQYRMHTDIMDIINCFYDDQLIDGNEDNYTYDTKAHYLRIRSTAGTEMIIPDRHAYWFDSSELQGVRIFEQRQTGSTSAENIVEAQIIVELLKKMEIQYANMAERTVPVAIGIISFYYDQVVLIRKMLRGESFHAINVEVNTVDRFQGKEKEIVFVSLVRNVKKSMHNLDSHIAAFQRINVAFSRAQNLLIIVGAKDMYADQPVKMTDMNDGTEKVVMVYKNIIEMMDQRGTYFTSDEVIPETKAYEILDSLSADE